MAKNWPRARSKAPAWRRPPIAVALEWCRLDPGRTQRRWPGAMLVERFAATLRNLADEAAAGASTAA